MNRESRRAQQRQFEGIQAAAIEVVGAMFRKIVQRGPIELGEAELTRFLGAVSRIAPHTAARSAAFGVISGALLDALSEVCERQTGDGSVGHEAAP